MIRPIHLVGYVRVGSLILLFLPNETLLAVSRVVTIVNL